MKIQWVRFQEIGPFQELKLDFQRGNPGLHVVFGANEAGKSCAMRYLGYFLFGIPRKGTCEDDFRFSIDKFLIESEVVCGGAQHNKPFLLRREKKPKRDLTAEKELQGVEYFEALFGGIGKEGYEQLFGLNQVELHHSAGELFGGKSDLSKTLFEAGAGFFDFACVQGGLDSWMDKQLAQRERMDNPPINETIKQFKNLKEKAKEEKVSRGDLDRLITRKKELENKENELRGKMQQNKGEQEDSLQVVQALPCLGRWTEARKKRASLQGLPTFSEEELKVFENAEIEMKVAIKSAEIHQDGMEVTRKDLEVTQVDEPILTVEKEIKSLNQGLENLSELLRDLPNREKERDGHLADARRLARDLYNHEDLVQIESLFPTLEKRKEINRVRFELKKCEVEIFAQEKKIDDDRRLMEENSRENEAVNPHPLRGKIEDLLNVIRNQHLTPMEIRHTSEALKDERQSLYQQLERMGHWEGKPDELLGAKLPQRNILSEFIDGLEDLKKEKSVLDLAIVGKKKDLAEKEKQVVAQQGNAPDLSPEKLLAIRIARDLAWKAFEENTPVPAEVQPFAAGCPDTKTAFLKLVVQTDNLADRMLDHGAMIGAILQLKRDIQFLKQELKGEEEKCSQVQGKIAELIRLWRELWKTADIKEPGEFREMETWVVEIQDWKEKFLALKVKEEAYQKHLQLAQVRFKEIRAVVSPGEIDNAILWERAEKFLRDEEKKASSLEQIKKQGAKIQPRVKSGEKDLEKLKVEKENLESAWMSLIEVLHLSPDFHSDNVPTYLEKIEEFREKMISADGQNNRAIKIRENIQGFQSRLTNVLTKLGNAEKAIEGDGMLLLMEKLYQELGKTLNARSQKEKLTAQMERLRQNYDEAKMEIGKKEAVLESLANSLGNVSIDQVGGFFNHLREKSKADADWRMAETELANLAGNEDLEKFEKRMEKKDIASARIHLDVLKQSWNEMDKELSEILKEKWATNNELEGLGRREGTHEIEAEKEELKALCLEQCREYAVYALAKTVLDKAVRDYMEKNEGPILSRAKPIFRELTLSRFTNIETTLASDGKYYFHLEQSTGEETRPLELGMKHLSTRYFGNTVLSDGTMDQLFLSLRLAAIDEHLEKLTEPVPIILDDILIQFDDDRKVAALDCLARLSDKAQVIFFTHHKHLGDLIPRCKEKGKIFFQEMASK